MASKFIVVCHSSNEWAELPGDFTRTATWAPALAYELTAGFWHGCKIEILSDEDELYQSLHDGAAEAWHNRTTELAERARSLGAATADWRPVTPK
jgi:hypothetical protein